MLQMDIHNGSKASTAVRGRAGVVCCMQRLHMLEIYPRNVALPRCRLARKLIILQAIDCTLRHLQLQPQPHLIELQPVQD